MKSVNASQTSFGDKFLELLAQSTIVQGLVTFALVAAVCYLSIMQLQVPDSLNAAMMLALGYYFGTKSQQVISSAIKK